MGDAEARPGLSASEALAERVKRAAASDAYRNYLDTRERVLQMQDAARRPGSELGPSAYWREELEELEYLSDASPLIVERLRRHTQHVTGLRVYDYREGQAKQHAQMTEKLVALRKLEGDSLLVGERPELGGFGFEIDGSLINLDTLKFFEVLIALERGGVLGAFRDPGRRMEVLEIGSGWGGFAYQFKTLFPRVRYTIVDLPELFLISATYLRTLFPDASFRFHVGDEPHDPDPGEVDFEFIPAHAIEAYQPDRLDLTINMVSFQEMTSAQVRGYAAHAHSLGSECIYSLNRDRSRYNAELSSVRGILDELFWLHEIPVMDVPYTKMLPGETPKSRISLLRRKGRGARSKNSYRHIVGWPRLLA